MSFTSDSSRWRALTIRDATANNAFVYSVKSTGIYCRPTCPARLARRANVGFYRTPAEAEVAGFRACKRCKPDVEVEEDSQGAAVEKACKLIEECVGKEGEEGKLRLQDLSKKVGLTPRYFHKIFKERMGVTPNEYAKSRIQGQKEVHEGSKEGEEPSVDGALDLDVFDFNDLVDFDLDPTPNLTMDTSTTFTTPEAANLGDQPCFLMMPVQFGYESDPNIPTADKGLDALGTRFDEEQLSKELQKYNSVGWDPRTPFVTNFELDAAFLQGDNIEFSDFNVDMLAGWG